MDTTDQSNIFQQPLNTKTHFPINRNGSKGCSTDFLLRSKDRSQQDRGKESNVEKCHTFQNAGEQSKETPEPHDTNDMISLKFLPVNVRLATEIKDGGSRYKMNSNPRGLALIINNIDFDDPEEFPTREGADNDEWRLKELWEKLHFRVEICRNKSSWEILMAVKALSERKELNDCDCVIVTVMSHGEEGKQEEDNSNIFGSDGIGIPIYDIIDHFDQEALKNKPKIFFFQSCRGTLDKKNESSFTHVSSSKEKNCKTILNEPGTCSANEVRSHQSDIFIACSVPPGRPANRDPIVGSWFVQSIIEVFAAKACNTHLDDLMKSVDLEIQNIYSMHHKTDNKRNLCSDNVQTTSIRKIRWNKNLYFNPGWARSILTGEMNRIGGSDLDGLSKNEKYYPESTSAISVKPLHMSFNESEREGNEDRERCCRVS